MKTYKKVVLILMVLSGIIAGFFACETDITVDLPRAQEKLNVQAYIELNEFPIVFLTKNTSYFDPIDTNKIKNLLIWNNDATVFVTCNGIVDTLVPHDFYIDETNAGPMWPYKGYIGTKFKGQIGSTYRLDIQYDNKDYFSTTTIKDTVGIDSVKYTPFIMSNTLDTVISGYLTLFWKNSPESEYFAVRTRSPRQHWFYRPMMVNVIDDKLNGEEPFLSCPFITRSYERNSYYAAPDDPEDTTSFMSKILFHPMDTVEIKLATLDDDAYLFWQSWERSRMTDGNPFVNPASVKSNIKGAPAVGSWIGYGSWIGKYFIDTTNLHIVKQFTVVKL
jgi:hypothetical protein